MNSLALTLLSLCFFMGLNAGAHPVSYQGSTGLMGYHSPMLTHNQLNHSFRYWFATGVHHIQRPNLKNRSATFASTNFLLKRWYGSGSQANIYSVFGVGQSELDKGSELAGLGLLQFDIEDRDYYFLAKHLRVFSDDRTDLEQTLFRVGLTPYVEKFEGLHSWLVLEWQDSHFSDGTKQTDLTPFLRIFYKNLLFEIGQSFDGATKFNYITHF